MARGAERREGVKAVEPVMREAAAMQSSALVSALIILGAEEVGWNSGRVQAAWLTPLCLSIRTFTIF